MRRPLELTVHERHGKIYVDPATGHAQSDRAVDMFAKAKRFIDAELAAESYRQMTRAIAESGLVTAMFGSDIVVTPGDAAVFGPVRLETSRLGDIKRFATLPHYDEVSA